MHRLEYRVSYPQQMIYLVTAMKILVIEDHPLYRQALGNELKHLFPNLQLTEIQDMEQCFSALKPNAKFDLILLDLRLPDSNGLGSLIAVVQLAGPIPIVVVSGMDEESIIHAALKAGAKGYIPKSAPSHVFRDAVNMVLSGETFVPGDMLRDTNPVIPQPLTTRQNAVLKYMALGCSNKEIAEILAIAEATVRVHATEIFRKLYAHNRTEAVLNAQKFGLVD